MNKSTAPKFPLELEELVLLEDELLDDVEDDELEELDDEVLLEELPVELEELLDELLEELDEPVGGFSAPPQAAKNPIKNANGASANLDIDPPK